MNRTHPSSNSPSRVRIHATLGTAVFSILLFALLTPYYATNDDAFIALILRGTGFVREPSPWTLYLNVILGKSLSTLYALWPGTAWYALLLTTTSALSFWVATAVLLQRIRCAQDRLLLALLLPSLFYLFLFRPQWTTVAVLAAAVGIMGIVDSLDRDRDPLPGWLGVLLLTVSSLIRTSALGLGVLSALPFFVLEWRRISGKHRNPRPLFLVLLATIAIPLLVQSAAHTKHPEWRDALRYAQLRAKLFQFVNVPFNERTEPLFKEIGWDRLDYDLYRTWYGGVGRFGLESLEKLDRLKPEAAPRPWNILGETLALPAMVFHACLLLLVFLWVPRKKVPLALLHPAWSGALLMSLLVILWAPYRVSAPVLAFTILAVIATALSAPESPESMRALRGWRALALFVITVLFASSLWQSSVMDHVFRDRETGFRRCTAELSKEKGLLVYFWGNGIHVDWLRAFDDYRTLDGLNLYPVGWLQSSPHAEAWRTRYSLADPIRDLVDRADLALAPSEALPWELYREYMKTKYDLDVKAQEVVNGMGCRVYRVITAGGR